MTLESERASGAEFPFEQAVFGWQAVSNLTPPSRAERGASALRRISSRRTACSGARDRPCPSRANPHGRLSLTAVALAISSLRILHPPRPQVHVRALL